MAQVIWTESALHDLDEIANYIALDQISAAKKLVRKIFASTDKLEQFPEIGRKPPELKTTRYLELIVAPCRIFHRVEKQRVFILFVMRSERELQNYILEERRNKLTKR